MMNASAALAPRALQPLPLGSIRPAGWLQRQLRLQADGLSGHLDEFWPDIARSQWIGGDAEGWERGPYWLDGMVPLAFLLDDPRLLAKVRAWVEAILARQQADGWLGPVVDERYGYPYDPWPGFIVLKALAQYVEATGDERVSAAMLRFVRRLDTVLRVTPLQRWAKHRWADLVLTIHWLYERTGEPWLLELAALVHAQGFDWRSHFEAFPYQTKTPRDQCTLVSHVVNNAMAVKAPGVWYRQSRDEADRQAVETILSMLDTYHGQVTGAFTGDEHLAGRNPSQGTELCAVVELMFSLEVLISALGGVSLADRLERLAYNALPATFTPDMWAHQYDQQVNQVLCRVAEDRIWTNNGPDAGIFGLAPNYGCCTANMHQGWPKFAAHLWMRRADGALAAVAYAPCTVHTDVYGTTVQIETATDYPFADTVQITVRAAGPVDFPLLLRVPGWTAGATLAIGDEEARALAGGDMHAVRRRWDGETVLRLHLPMPIEVVRGYRESVALRRGPLVYALPIGEDWRRIGGELPHADWEVYPTSPWNYGLCLDVKQPERSVRIDQRPVGERPFSPGGAPVRLSVRGRLVPGWALEHNAAGPVPVSPCQSTSPDEGLTLIPYGATNLRVTEFPLVARCGPE